WRNGTYRTYATYRTYVYGSIVAYVSFSHSPILPSLTLGDDVGTVLSNVRDSDDAAVSAHPAEFTGRYLTPFSARRFLRTLVGGREGSSPDPQCGFDQAKWDADVRCTLPRGGRLSRPVDQGRVSSRHLRSSQRPATRQDS